MDRDAEIKRCREGISMILEGLDDRRMGMIADMAEYLEYLRAGRVVGYYLALRQNVPVGHANVYATACELLASKLHEAGLFSLS